MQARVAREKTTFSWFFQSAAGFPGLAPSSPCQWPFILTHRVSSSSWFSVSSDRSLLPA